MASAESDGTLHTIRGTGSIWMYVARGDRRVLVDAAPSMQAPGSESRTLSTATPFHGMRCYNIVQ